MVFSRHIFPTEPRPLHISKKSIKNKNVEKLFD